MEVIIFYLCYLKITSGDFSTCQFSSVSCRRPGVRSLCGASNSAEVDLPQDNAVETFANAKVTWCNPVFTAGLLHSCVFAFFCKAR